MSEAVKKRGEIKVLLVEDRIDDAELLLAEMRRRGILVRDRNADPGCAGCVRITLGNRAQTERLLGELGEALAAIGFIVQQRLYPSTPTTGAPGTPPTLAGRETT